MFYGPLESCLALVIYVTFIHPGFVSNDPYIVEPVPTWDGKVGGVIIRGTGSVSVPS